MNTRSVPKKAYLPIGSVVVLKDGTMPLMIFGRKQTAVSDGRLFDYAAVPYPEGNSNAEHTYAFNHDDIETLLFIGLQTEKEERLQRYLLDIDQGKSVEAWNG